MSNHVFRDPRAIAVASDVASAVLERLGTLERWERLEAVPRTLEPDEPQHAEFIVLRLGVVAEFSIWSEVMLLEGREREPVLCAAFAVPDSYLQQMRTTLRDRFRVRNYGRPDRDRASGYNQQPIIEASTLSFLSYYRPPKDYNLDAAAEAMVRFFHDWRWVFESFLPKSGDAPKPETPPRDASLPAGLSLALQGVVGELAVLSLPKWNEAEWVALNCSTHDLERTTNEKVDLVEVKCGLSPDFSPVVSRDQINASADPMHVFAFVELTRQGLDLLLSPDVRGIKGTPSPFVLKRRMEIQNHLRNLGIAFDETFFLRLSKVLECCRVTWHRMSVPPAWDQAVTALEQQGRIVSLRQECRRELWFRGCREP